MAKNGKRLGFLPGWRKGTYIILIFNLIMLVWVVAGVASTTHNPNCGQTNKFFTQQDCQSATDAGATIGAGIIITFWAIGDVILGVLWLVTNRKKTRDCPACGSDVKKGLFACRSCGFDFRSLAYGSQQQAPAYSPNPQPNATYPQGPSAAAVYPAPVTRSTPAPAPIRIPEQADVLHPRQPSNAEIRQWARHNGYDVSDKGRVPAAIVEAFHAASV